jgi:hypothetical protein
VPETARNELVPHASQAALESAIGVVSPPPSRIVSAPDARARVVRLQYDSVMPIVAGVRVSREQALDIAAMLTRAGFDRTARILLDAVTNRQEFVALATDDREAILAVLDHPSPDELVELRTVLFDELNWQRGLIGAVRPRSRSPYANQA